MNEDNQSVEPPPISGNGNLAIETRTISQLRAHPVGQELGLDEIEIPGSLRSNSLNEPFVISSSGIVLKGLDQFRKLRDQQTLPVNCLVCPLDDFQALHWIIAHSERQSGYSPYARNIMAFELIGDCITEAARENMRLGGRYKGLPNLENLSQVHVNKEIAKITNTAVGYVGYARKLRNHAVEEVKRALLTGEVPIYRAIEFLKGPRSQRECLADFRAEATRASELSQAMRDLRKRTEGILNASSICNGILRLTPEQRRQIRIGSTRAEGSLILLSNKLIEDLESEGGLFNES